MNTDKLKGDILEARLGNYAKMFGGSVTIDIFYSMEEYAEQISILFSEWKDLRFQKVRDNCYIHIPESLPRFKENKTYTHTQLFQLFIKHLNEQK